MLELGGERPLEDKMRKPFKRNATHVAIAFFINQDKIGQEELIINNTE